MYPIERYFFCIKGNGKCVLLHNFYRKEKEKEKTKRTKNQVGGIIRLRLKSFYSSTLIVSNIISYEFSA